VEINGVRWVFGRGYLLASKEEVAHSYLVVRRGRGGGEADCRQKLDSATMAEGLLDGLN
jgi:hypothetical protein